VHVPGFAGEDQNRENQVFYAFEQFFPVFSALPAFVAAPIPFFIPIIIIHPVQLLLTIPAHVIDFEETRVAALRAFVEIFSSIFFNRYWKETPQMNLGRWDVAMWNADQVIVACLSCSLFGQFAGRFYGSSKPRPRSSREGWAPAKRRTLETLGQEDYRHAL